MMKDRNLNIVLLLIEKENVLEAKKIFDEIIPEESVDYFFVKGILEQKYQNWGEAINAFSRVLELDPDNKEAKNNLHIIQNILNFWNPEMFNP